jgi:hypothetical protein
MYGSRSRRRTKQLHLWSKPHDGLVAVESIVFWTQRCTFVLQQQPMLLLPNNGLSWQGKSTKECSLRIELCMYLVCIPRSSTLSEGALLLRISKSKSVLLVVSSITNINLTFVQICVFLGQVIDEVLGIEGFAQLSLQVLVQALITTPVLVDLVRHPRLDILKLASSYLVIKVRNILLTVVCQLCSCGSADQIGCCQKRERKDQ